MKTSTEEHFEMKTKDYSKEVDTLHKKIADLEDRLKQEVENNTALEQYTRRENLRFNITSRRRNMKTVKR